MALGTDGVDGGRRRAAIAAAVLSYATALVLSYVATFIYFVNTPFRPNGPYGKYYCVQPHVIFGQICRVWTMHGIDSPDRLGLGACFLVLFLLLSVAARKLPLVLLVIPFATLPWVNTERMAWALTTGVTLVSVGALLALDLWASPRVPRGLRWVPLVLLTIGTSAAVVLSVLTSGPTLTSISGAPGLTIWPSVQVSGLECPAAGSCVATGGTWSGVGSTLAFELARGVWTGPSTVAPTTDANNPQIACARPGECLAVGYDLLVAEHDGRWGSNQIERVPHINAVYPLTARRPGCSPSGACWAIATVQLRDEEVGSYAIGERNGHWLPPKLLGPSLPVSNSHGEDFTFFSGLSCWSAASCTFVGQGASGATANPPRRLYVQTEHDGVWSPAQSIPSRPIPDGPFADPLYAPFVCLSSGNCLLGGQFGPSQQGVVRQEVNGRWLPVVTGIGMTPGATQSQIDSLDCASTRLCVVSGTGGTDAHPTLFFEAEEAGRWQAPLTVDTGAFARPTATACLEPTRCYVVGWLETTNHLDAAFEASDLGGSWSFEPLALYQGENETELLALSCRAGGCWAAGAGLRQGSNWARGFVYEIVPPTR